MRAHCFKFPAVECSSSCCIDFTTMPKYFMAYCPRADGTPCRKGTQKLGSYYSERDARQAIYNHLYGSIHHQLSEADATDEADRAELAECEYEDDDQREERDHGKEHYHPPTAKTKSSKPATPANPPKSGSTN